MHAVNTSAVRLTLQGGGEGHRFGINAIGTSGESLLTAGRDGTVRSWSVHAGSANLEHTLDEHSDWVNGIAVLHPGSFATCSSDRSVKVWSMPSDGTANWQCHTIGRHEDYAKAICYAAQCNLLATAGFDCRILLWDARRLAPISASTVAPPPPGGTGSTDGASASGAHHDSIYALDCNASGTVLATGSVDTDVRLWDPRDMRSSRRLRGHGDVVRCVCLLDDGVRAVSCSSDRTIRLWHVAEPHMMLRS